MEYTRKVIQKKDFRDAWQKAINETGENVFKKIAENWQKI